ncbi:MAG TPA: 30S ribosomal protein S18 [Candidatus Campbellbacteria bacterium]|nr:30S ribosomal protein S18 [Candidatus Campbellbacteria bacterium]
MKQCHFCTNNIKTIDYKDTENLKRFLDPFSKIIPRKQTGLCAKHQRKFAQAVKRSRFMALIPFVSR